MFTKIASVILAVVFLVSQATSLQVGTVGNDLWEQASEKLHQLRTIVQGSITENDNKLKTLVLEVSDHANQVKSAGLRAIAEEQTTLKSDLDSIKSLAESSGTDISRCLRYNEPKLNNLPKLYSDGLESCIASQVNKGNNDITNAKYKVDQSLITVSDLEHQFNLCGHTDFLCISPIIKQVNVLIQQIPFRANLDVSEATQLVEAYKLSMQDCSDAKVGEYDSAGNAVINDIQICAFD